MSAPNMETITASLERSLQNCSLNSHPTRRDEGEASAAVVSDDASSSHLSNSDATLDLNSHISLPYHWEQCLDLKTGEIYYINWRNGMKAKEDPRRLTAGDQGENSGEYYYYSEEEEEEESCYDSEESSSESWSSSTAKHHTSHHQQQQQSNNNNNNNNNVLVVAGCKICLMYFMVPKQVQHCPKCTGQLLHFDRSDTTDSPSP